MSVNAIKSSNQIIIYLALIGLLFGGLWLRLRFIHTVQLYPDEFVTLLAVRMINEKGAPVMPSGLFYDHGLLFSYLGSLASWLGPARWAVRYASLVCGALTLLLTFWIGRRWFSAAVGLIAVAGLAIAPGAIHWSGRARMYALLQLLVLLALWLAYEGFAQNRARLRWAALVVYLGAALTHFAAITLAPALILAVLAGWGLQTLTKAPDNTGAAKKSPLLSRFAASLAWLKSWKVWLEIVALSGVILIAFLVKRAGQPTGIEPLDSSNALAGLIQVLSIYSDLSLNLSQGWQAVAPFYLSLPALIFSLFALAATVNGISDWKRGRIEDQQRGQKSHPPDAPYLFLVIILVMTTLEIILLVSPDRRDDKYIFMLLPVLLLLGAQGLALVNNRLSTTVFQKSGTHSTQSPIFPLLSAGLILIIAQPAVQALLRNTGDDYDSAFAYIQTHWQAGDTILTGTPAAAAFYLGRNDFYSVQRRGGYDYRILTVAGQPVDRWLASPAIRTETALHQTLTQHRVWLLLERWGLQREYYDLPFQQQLLAQTDTMTEVQGIFILRSKPAPHPLRADPAHSTQADFGGLVHLLGYTVEPEQAEPGQSLRLTLYWQALVSLPHDYTVLVHLRRPAGGNVAQADHRPLGNLYPTTLWPPGEIIRESSELLLPADLSPGSYELWTGLYLLETGERLPVHNDISDENAVKLGEVQVGP